MLDLHFHRELINQVLSEYGLNPSTALVVDDVKVWCQDHGIEEKSSSRLARCFPLRDPFLIVLRAELPEGLAESAKSRMKWDGLDDQVAALDSEEKFLVHLLLHEIAALVLNTPEQLSRDEWAFRELPKHLSKIRPARNERSG